MSRKGNCYDNSVMVNFFNIMKSEFLYIREFESIEHFKIELEKYINYYNMKTDQGKIKNESDAIPNSFTQTAKWNNEANINELTI